jgi:GNAT superfamily N-acetyltransferase
MRWHRALASLRDALRRLGLRDGVLFATATVLSRASGGRARLHRYCFVAQPVTGPLMRSTNAGSEVIRQVDAGDPLVAQFPRPPAVIAQRFRMGAHCFVAERAGRFVGFLWLKESRYPEDEVRCDYVLEPTDGAVWDFDVHVEPAFRLGRTFVRLWDYANAWMREHGYRWTISRISAFNRDSLAAHARLGIRPIGTATFLRFGVVQVALLDRAPFVHAGWRHDQTPVLHLRPPVDEASG